MSDSVFARVGLAYRFEPAGKGVTFIADQIKWKDGDLVSLVEVRADRSGLPAFLTRHRVNLTGGRGKVDFSRLLAQRCQKDEGGYPVVREDEWLALVESLAIRVGDAEQQGDPVVWVGDEEPPEGSPYIVARLIEQGGTNMLFGPGDQGKSWLGRYLSICVQLGIPAFGTLQTRQKEALWVDYETDRDTDTRRVRAILRGMGLPYRAFRRWEPKDSLLRQVGPLSRILAAEQIGAYWVDSAGHAAGSPGESGWEDVALNLSKATRALLPATGTLLDHVTAEASGQKLAGRPSGAYRKFADVRNMWEVRKSQEQENAWMVTGLYHTKGNNSLKWRPIGVRLEFESDVWGRAICVRFSRDDDALKSDAEHAGRQSLKVRILASLEGQLTIVQLAKAVGADAESVGAKLRELRQEGLTRTLAEYKGGRGAVQKWEKCGGESLPEYPNALKENTVRSGNGGSATHPPYPNTRIEDYPNVRVNDGSPSDSPSGATEARSNGRVPGSGGAHVWAGDAEETEDVPF